MPNESKTPETDATELEAHIGVTSFGGEDIAAAYNFARQLELSRDEWRKLCEAFDRVAFQCLPSWIPEGTEPNGHVCCELTNGDVRDLLQLRARFRELKKEGE